jgi:hypothetical protein
MSKKQRNRGPCVYCGDRTATTADHVIPRSLFQRPLPVNLIKVPACEPCNNQKSQSEDYLRDMLAVSSAERHPVAEALLSGAMARSVSKNRSQIWRAAQRSLLVPRYDEAGNYLGDYFKIPVEANRLNQLFTVIVRGLYYHLCKQRLPKIARIDVRYIDNSQMPSMLQALQSVQIPFKGPYNWGDSIFQCLYIPVDEDLMKTYWFMGFYDSYFLLARTQLPTGGLPINDSNRSDGQ